MRVDSNTIKQIQMRVSINVSVVGSNNAISFGNLQNLNVSMNNGALDDNELAALVAKADQAGGWVDVPEESEGWFKNMMGGFV